MVQKLLKSRTIQLAIIQAVIGISVVVATEMDATGAILIIKSIGDIVLRMYTVEAIDAK